MRPRDDTLAAGEVGTPRPRFEHFDSLRAIAALAVVLTHTSFVSGAIFVSSFKGIFAHLNVGVTVFFVISGFLLYRPYVAARATGAAPPSWRGYARRRFLRIAPAYWLALTALAVFPGLAGVFTGNWWVYYGLLQSYPIYTPTNDCATAIQGCGIAPTWSLAIELAFYVTLPLYAALIHRFTAKARYGARLWSDLIALSILAASSIGLRLWSLHRPSLWWLYGTIVDYFAWFALGMGLAVASVAVERRRRDTARPALPIGLFTVVWAAALGLFLLLALRLLPPTAASIGLGWREHLLEHIGLGVVAVLLLIPAVFAPPHTGLPNRVLGNRVLSWLGTISYGIFLWHFAVMFYVADAGAADWLPGNPFFSLSIVTLAVTVVCAAASFYVVEKPVMRWSRRHEQRRFEDDGAAPRVRQGSSGVPVMNAKSTGLGQNTAVNVADVMSFRFPPQK